MPRAVGQLLVAQPPRAGRAVEQLLGGNPLHGREQRPRAPTSADGHRQRAASDDRPAARSRPGRGRRARRCPTVRRTSCRCPAKTWQASAKAPRTTPRHRPRLPRPLQSPDHERDARQGVDHARVDQVRPGEPAQPEEGRARQGPRRADVPAEPAVGPRAGQPDREDGVEVERLPGLHPGIEQVLERVQISRLALAVERHPAVEPGAPPREPAGPQLLGEEEAIRVIDLGDVEVEERPPQASRRRGRSRRRPRSRSPARRDRSRPHGRRWNQPVPSASPATVASDTITPQRGIGRLASAPSPVDGRVSGFALHHGPASRS